MARTYTVQGNQSMMDVIIQSTGSLEAGWQLCADNDMSITDDPVPGTVIIVSDAALALGDAGVLQYLAGNPDALEGVVLATLATAPDFSAVIIDEAGEIITDESGNELTL